MNHKEKCKVLKNVRKEMADQIGIDLHQRECTYEGECSGTCPKCEAEERALNRALLLKKAVIAGMAVVSTFGMTACFEESIDGGIAAPPEEIEDIAGEIDDEYVTLNQQSNANTDKWNGRF